METTLLEDREHHATGCSTTKAKFDPLVRNFFYLIKEIDVDFLKTMNGAELVELVMDLVEDERLVVIGRVVSDNVKNG